MRSSDYPDYVPMNVAIWTKINAEYTHEAARSSWANENINWGIWGVPESELGILGDIEGLDTVELGCGTAYMSAKLARHGARVVGVDPTPAQLATAREMQAEFGLEFRLVEAAGEHVPLPDASFDLVHSEYGASLWADPYGWIPEASRLLRPNGRLVFLCNSTLVVLCQTLEAPASDKLVRAQKGLHKIEWPDTGEVGFHLGHGDWIDLLRENDFEVERLIELYAPDDAVTHDYYDDVTADWARKWPAEEIWVARKRA